MSYPFKIILFCFIPLSLFAQNNYTQIHQDALVVDMHADALYSLFSTGRSLEKYSTRGHVDLVRLKQGGIDVEFFAVWPDPDKKEKQSTYEQSAEMLDTLDQILQRNPGRIELAVSADEIIRVTSQNKIAVCIGLEGGSAIDADLKKLKYFYDRGVRYLSLTWNDSPSWASSAADEAKKSWKGHRGLNDFGRRVIKEMNELGMMVDVSHSGVQTFYDVIEMTTKPIIASHSSVYSICPHSRNLKDGQIKALAKNGGVMFINFNPGFLVKGFDKIYQKSRKDADSIQDSLKAIGKLDTFDRPAFIHSKIDPIYPSVKTVVDHIDYVVKLVGDDFVGLGSDFDGISLTPNGLRDVSKMPAITKELVKRRYTEDSIRKILGGNFMRVFELVSQ